MDNKGSYELRDLLHKGPHRIEEEEAEQDNIREQETNRNISGTKGEGRLDKEEHAWARKRQTFSQGQNIGGIRSKKVGSDQLVLQEFATERKTEDYPEAMRRE